MVQAQVQLGQAGGLRHRKLIMVGACLALTYIGWFLGRDPSQLALIVGSLVTTFCAADAYIEKVYNSNGTDNPPRSGNNGG